MGRSEGEQKMISTGEFMETKNERVNGITASTSQCLKTVEKLKKVSKSDKNYSRIENALQQEMSRS